MEQTTTIRQNIEYHLKDRGWSISQFAQTAGVNSGSLSRILNGNKSLSMMELHRITAALGLPEDYFFTSYAEELLTSTSMSWRKIRPFLIRSAEIQRLDCIETIVHHLLEHLSYVPKLFEAAEELFHTGNYPAAFILYQGVRDSEKYQHSERLALCQYRLFLIAIGDDFNENLRSATIFEPYLERLEIPERLDAIHRLAHVFGSVHQWEKVDKLAIEMLRIAQFQFEQEASSQEVSWRLKNPSYYYILYSYLMRSVVQEELGNYEKALKYVSLYEDVSWIHTKSKQAKRIMKKFQEWAKANKLLYNLMLGDFDVIPHYLEWVSTNEHELPTALCKIVQAANRHGINVDSILDRYSSYLPNQSMDRYDKMIVAEQHAYFLIQLGVYYLRNNRARGIDCLLQGLDVSVKLNSDKNIIRCLTFYEQYRHLSKPDETDRYQFLVDEVKKRNETSRSLASSFE